MIINKAPLDYISNVVKLADLVKIDNIIIEPDRVRAIDEARTVMILQTENVPPMPFGSIGINRIDDFSSRFAITHSMADFEVAVTVEGADPATSFARALQMKAKGIKIDYRCANPATIKAPKAINDAVKFRAIMHPEAVLLMQKAQSAMRSDEIAFVGSDDGLLFQVSDVNTDMMQYKIADRVQAVEAEEGTPVKFNYKYPIKTITTLFRQVPDAEFSMTARGMLKLVVTGLDIYVMPRI